MESLYRDAILSHNRYPEHYGRLSSPTYTSEAFNPLCGDRITLDIVTTEEGVIKELGWVGVGCALSRAAMSMCSAHLIGKSVNEVKHFGKEEIEHAMGITTSGLRAKCMLLPLIALEYIASQYHE